MNPTPLNRNYLLYVLFAVARIPTPVADAYEAQEIAALQHAEAANEAQTPPNPTESAKIGAQTNVAPEQAL